MTEQLSADLAAFLAEHERCGDPDTGMTAAEAAQAWIACSCGARLQRSADPEQALAALVARQQEIAAGKLDRPAERTLRQLADEYLAYKADRGKRSLKEDRRITLRAWRRSKGRACK